MLKHKPDDPLLLRLRYPVFVAIEPLLDQKLALEAMNAAADEIERLRALVIVLKADGGCEVNQHAQP